MSKQERRITMRVKRYRPERSSQPYYQEYHVPYGEDKVVLDALNYIKDHIDGSLSYRWSCRMGICGSCGAVVNGVPRLTCETFIRNLGSDRVTVEPLHNFPVIKDLVVDIADFMVKLRGIEPWVIRYQEKSIEEGEHLQTPEQMELYHQFSMCINCMLCYSACPVYAVDKHFIGPAAAALAYRYMVDSRDQAKNLRLLNLQEHGIFDCTFVGECSAVCPKNVDPAIALQRLKLDTVKWLLMPGLKK